ncbi:hypothetical protein [uncultured Arcobacter sp.]|uniref:hypothetical protein n=1 Tax=uncultured Arcobacter sp. TaxID=165434 RepID=UPI00261A9E93|nr:hypothetical protein [uncultured Arcobacter sp.]
MKISFIEEKGTTKHGLFIMNGEEVEFIPNRGEIVTYTGTEYRVKEVITNFSQHPVLNRVLK